MELGKQIQALCELAVRKRTFPGCSVGYIRSGRAVVLNYGSLTYEADAPIVRDETIYDVASITKSVATASLMLKLLETGRITLDDKVIDFIPELKNEHRENILIRHLLTYTVTFDLDGGVAALARANPDRVVEQLLRVPLVSPPGESYWYTNGPAILMGLVVERVYRQALDKVALNELFEPLGMNRSTFEPSAARDDLVAPTEIGTDGDIKGRSRIILQRR